MSERKYLKLTPDEDGDTILHFAAADDNYKLIATYIKHGANVDIQNFIGWTPLMIAVKNGHLKSAMVLIHAGADPTKRNGYGISVLSIAVSSGSLGIVKFILKNIINFNYNSCSITPLVIATWCDNIDIIQYLLSNSCKIDSKTEIGGLTPSFVASIINNKEVLNIFQKYSTATNNSEENENIIPTYREVPEIRIFNEFNKEKNNFEGTFTQRNERKCSSVGAFDSFINDFSPIFNMPDSFNFFPHLQHSQKNKNYENNMKKMSRHDNTSVSVIPSDSKRVSINQDEEYIDDVFENLSSVSENKLENLYINIKEYAENSDIRANNSILVKDLPKIPKYRSKSSSMFSSRISKNVSRENVNNTKREDWPVCDLRNPHRCRSSTQVFHQDKIHNNSFEDMSSVKSTSEIEKSELKPPFFKIRKCTSLGCFDIYVKKAEINMDQKSINLNSQNCNPNVQKFIQNYNQLKNTHKVQHWLSTNVY